MKKLFVFLLCACALRAHAQLSVQNILPHWTEITATSAPFRVAVTTSSDTAHVSIQWWDWNHIDSLNQVTSWWMTEVVVPPFTTDTLTWLVDTLAPSTTYGWNGFLYPGLGENDTLWANTLGHAYFSTYALPSSVTELSSTDSQLFVWNSTRIQFHSSVKRAEIYTLEGLLVGSTSTQSLLLPPVSPGIYLVRCFTRDKTHTKKIYIGGN